MPNYVINEVVFHDVCEDLQARIIAAACDQDRLVDFNVLVPTPRNIWWGNVGSKHTETFPDTALDWNRKNWGTKWNALRPRPVESSTNSLTLRFETAWKPPYGWLVALFNSFTAVSFMHHWLDEGAERARTGRWMHGDGPLFPSWDEGAADDADHQRMYALLWGADHA